MLGPQLESLQNLSFYLWLVGEARKHIQANTFSTWKPVMVQKLKTRL
jgi:queuine tRNA-ribosyltransferase